ncbi:hypothetical protein [Corallococcus sp. ZKHCc1 1396]
MTSLESKMAALERRVFGKKTEKLPPVAQQLRGEARGPEQEAARAEAAWRSGGSARSERPRRPRRARCGTRCRPRHVTAPRAAART